MEGARADRLSRCVSSGYGAAPCWPPSVPELLPRAVYERLRRRPAPGRTLISPWTRDGGRLFHPLAMVTGAYSPDPRHLAGVPVRTCERRQGVLTREAVGARPERPEVHAAKPLPPGQTDVVEALVAVRLQRVGRVEDAEAALVLRLVRAPGECVEEEGGVRLPSQDPPQRAGTVPVAQEQGGARQDLQQVPQLEVVDADLSQDQAQQRAEP